jgi:hypothetical protein
MGGKVRFEKNEHGNLKKSGIKLIEGDYHGSINSLRTWNLFTACKLSGHMGRAGE